MTKQCAHRIPAGMHAMEIRHSGGPDVLCRVTRPTPTPGRDEVLIRVVAAGVNRPDILQRKGLYPPPPGASDLPGLEVAGVVAASGANVAEWRPGARVCALLEGGGYAEYALAHQHLCLPVPRGLSLAEAAGLPEAYFTAWSNLMDRVRLRHGETLLVVGGAGGVGSAAVQLAHALGATVFATAGTAEKADFCASLGAAAVIDYRREDVAARIQALTSGRGVDVIFDILGGASLQRSLDCLAPDGRLALVGLQGGSRAELSLAPVLTKRLTLTGSTLRPRSTSCKAAIADALRDKIWPLFERGVIRPVLSRVFALEDAPAAHRVMESGEHWGKMVLAIQPDEDPAA